MFINPNQLAELLLLGPVIDHENRVAVYPNSFLQCALSRYSEEALDLAEKLKNFKLDGASDHGEEKED